MELCRVGGVGGWLALVDDGVRDALLARHPRIDPGDITGLLRAIRNIAEHWFEPSATRAEQEALCSLTGCSIDETRRGQATAEASKRRAEAMTAYFLAPSRFPELLIVFHTSCAAMAAQAGPARPFGHK